jgi:hypothetical protein
MVMIRHFISKCLKWNNNGVQMLENTTNEQWEIEFEESDLLTRIDGFLMMYSGVGRITVNTKLTPEQKDRTRHHLLDKLGTLPVYKTGVILLRKNELL